MTEITFSGRFIKDAALDVLLDFSTNKFITKTSPGIGVTTALLNYTEGNLIIISPLTPMILKKEESKKDYKSDVQFFKCNELRHNKWKQVSDYLSKRNKKNQNLIINTTPDSISHLYEHDQELFWRLSNIPIVIDEYDTVIMQSQLREQCGRFMELIFHKWRGAFTLTTATPNYQYIDVPDSVNITHYKVGRAARKNFEVSYSNNYNDTFSFIANEIESGNKVACFTNNLNIHKRKFSRLQKSMVGESLALKLEYYDIDTERVSTGNPFEKSNVVVFSGKYFVGYDIDEDVSVVVISEAKNPATRIGVNQTIQALHRCRGKVKNILYINSSLIEGMAPLDQHIIATQKSLITEIKQYEEKALTYSYNWQVRINESITPELYCNRSKLAANVLNQIYWFELHMYSLLEKRFKEFNIDLQKYEVPEVDLTPSKSTRFNERILNVLECDNIEEMLERYSRVKNDIRFNNQGSHNTNRAMERLTAILIKKINCSALSEKLQKSSLKSQELYNYLDRFLQVNYPMEHLSTHYSRSQQSLGQMVKLPEVNKIEINRDLLIDWYLYFAAYRVKKEDFPEELNRYYLVRKTAGNWNNLVEYEKDTKNRQNRAFRKVKNLLDDEITELTEKEIQKIKEIIKNGYDDHKNHSYKKYAKGTLRRNLTNTIYYFINPNIAVPSYNSREYNPLTRFPKAYRGILPFDYILIDLISANAQFVDQLIGTDIADSVYPNLMDQKGYDRDTAKKKFNKFLNNHYLSSEEAITFYILCGYSLESARDLAKITCGVEKGSVYKKMTALEKPIIRLYQQEFDDKGIRIHDGLVLAPWDIEKPLHLSVNGIKFKVSNFINNSSYTGEVIHQDVEWNFIL